MAKVVIHILAAVGIGYYAYKVVRKALNEPPEEERVYSSTDAAIADGASADDEWLWSDLDGPQCF